MACKMGCCANKCCCAESQENHSLPSQPLVKSSANHELIAVGAPGVALTIFFIQSVQVPPQPSETYIINSAPRPALLCTFLI